ncbi:2OG-Fe(II) oxygenase family protein [Nocardia sp. CC227C]|uniref:2OG-Fe(II) oxygenase family protein n=1 Tax=Nocardia sp. CC227C TaxID=3044562 RepID=UPI00278BD606|nr:2OG-Fe(II) oxygenase family protein [Nocardia sp. CC227C]
MNRTDFGARLRDALADTGVCYLVGVEMRQLPHVDVLAAARRFCAHAAASGVIDIAHLPDDVATAPLRQSVSDWARGLAALSPDLLAALASALGYPEDHFDRWVGRVTTVRPQLVHVVARPDRRFAPDTAVHGDTGFLTFLLPDLLCGLLVEDAAGQWWDVPPRENSVLLTVGGEAEAATAGRVRAAAHRLWSPHAAKGRVAVTVAVESSVPPGAADRNEFQAAPPRFAANSPG